MGTSYFSHLIGQRELPYRTVKYTAFSYRSALSQWNSMIILHGLIAIGQEGTVLNYKERFGLDVGKKFFGIRVVIPRSQSVQGHAECGF